MHPVPLPTATASGVARRARSAAASPGTETTADAPPLGARLVGRGRRGASLASHIANPGAPGARARPSDAASGRASLTEEEAPDPVRRGPVSDRGSVSGLLFASKDWCRSGRSATGGGEPGLAAAVRGPKHVVTKGATPVLTAGRDAGAPRPDRHGEAGRTAGPGAAERAGVQLRAGERGRGDAASGLLPAGTAGLAAAAREGREAARRAGDHRAEEAVEAYLAAGGVGRSGAGRGWRRSSGGRRRRGNASRPAVSVLLANRSCRRRAVRGEQSTFVDALGHSFDGHRRGSARERRSRADRIFMR